MSNLLLAGFGTFVTMLALAGFSVYHLEKTAAEAGSDASDAPDPANASTVSTASVPLTEPGPAAPGTPVA